MRRPHTLRSLSLERLEDRALLSANPLPAGVYTLVQNVKPIPAAVLSNPNVDGISLYLSWNNVETGKGVYDWSYLDSQIAAAGAAGKMVSLSIKTGTATPSWVYADGAAAFNFISTKISTVQTIPVPWDPVFLADWTTFVSALGARYASNPIISDVKITGINTTTQETALPLSTGQIVTLNGQTWTTTNDVSNWQSAGYTSTKVENAWLQIADRFAAAFPNEQVTGIFYPGSLPPIGADGSVLPNKPNNDPLMLDMIAQGAGRYGPRFILQNDAVSAIWLWSQLSCRTTTMITGAQTVWSVTGDTTGRMNGGVTGYDMATVLQQAADLAYAGGVNFVEFYVGDVADTDLATAIAHAHAELTQKVSLTATANAQTKEYGQSNPTLTGTFSGVVVDGDGISASYTTTAGKWADAGQYDITPVLNDPYGRLTKYNVTATSTKLTITPANQTIVWASPAAIPGGTPLSAVQLSATVAGVAGGTAPGALSYSVPVGTFLGPGWHSLTVTAAATQNYCLATATVQIYVSALFAPKLMAPPPFIGLSPNITTLSLANLVTTASDISDPDSSSWFYRISGR